MNQVELCAVLSRLAYKEKDEKILKRLEELGIKYKNFDPVIVDDLKCFLIQIEGVEYLVFRGTSCLKTWIDTNFKFKKKKIGRKLKVHRGFLKAFNKLMGVIHYPNFKNKKVVVTGHSLGGALAQLTSNQLHQFGYDVECVAFEPPRIANKNYIEFTEEYNFKRIIIKNNIDIVPHVPPLIFGYSDYKESILYIDRKDEVLLNPSFLFCI